MRKILLMLLVIAIIVIGFSRDFLFKSINALLRAWDNEIDYSMPVGLRFFEEMEYDNIVTTKWILTFLFGIIYLSVSVITVNIIFRNKRFNRLTLYTFVALILFSAILSFIGMLSEDLSDKCYDISRYFMGIVQSPLVLMILVPAFIFARKLDLSGTTKKTNPEE